MKRKNVIIIVIIFLLILFYKLIPLAIFKMGDLFFEDIKYKNICIKRPENWHFVSQENKLFKIIDLKLFDGDLKDNNMISYTQYKDNKYKIVFITPDVSKEALEVCKDKNTSICVRRFRDGLKEALFVKSGVIISSKDLDNKIIDVFEKSIEKCDRIR